METASLQERNARMNQAIAKIQSMIAAQHPSASFAVSRGDDPEGVYLTVTVDLEDADEIVPLFLEQMLHFQIEEGLPLYVIPIETIERAAARRTASALPRGMALLPIAS